MWPSWREQGEVKQPQMDTFGGELARERGYSSQGKAVVPPKHMQFLLLLLNHLSKSQRRGSGTGGVRCCPKYAEKTHLHPSNTRVRVQWSHPGNPKVTPEPGEPWDKWEKTLWFPSKHHSEMQMAAGW